MSIQTLSTQETEHVAGGLLVSLGNNPIVNGALDVTPGGVFALVGSLLGGLTGLLKGLPLLGGLLGGLGS